MINQLNTFNTTNVFVVFIYALLYTQHICLFLDLSRLQKYPLSQLNYVNAGILSAIITTGSFYALKVSPIPHNIMWVATIGFMSATAITLTIQRLLNWMFHREKTPV